MCRGGDERDPFDLVGCLERAGDGYARDALVPLREILHSLGKEEGLRRIAAAYSAHEAAVAALVPPERVRQICVFDHGGFEEGMAGVADVAAGRCST